MDHRYRDFRCQVLLARQAYLTRQAPVQLSRYLLAAARELLLLAGDIPPGMLRGINQKALWARLELPDMKEPVQLMAQAQRLAARAPRAVRSGNYRRWREQAYQLLWRLDSLLVELASRRRHRSPRWMPRAFTYVSDAGASCRKPCFDPVRFPLA